MSEVSLGFADNNGTSSVVVGDIVSIALKQNAASTGFEWGVARFSEEQLAFLGRSSDLDTASAGGIGSGQQDAVFRFRAIGVGPGFVELGLSRGDPHVSASLTFHVDVNVADKS